MPPSCCHCDQPDVSLLRLVLIGEILRADEPLLVLLADLLQTSGLLPLAAAEPAACAPARRSSRPRQGRRQDPIPLGPLATSRPRGVHKQR